MSAENCVFCRIAAGDIPSAKVYEDDQVIAFLDLAPVHPGHVLVVPKEHYADILGFPAECAAAVCGAVQKVAAAQMKALGATGVNVLQNNGAAAGQAVFHIHWHVIPRFDGDGLRLWNQKSYGDGEMLQTAEKLAAAINDSSRAEA